MEINQQGTTIYRGIPEYRTREQIHSRKQSLMGIRTVHQIPIVGVRVEKETVEVEYDRFSNHTLQHIIDQ